MSEDLKEKAISSYKEAAELYEKKGDLSRSQEIHARIHELENESESSPPTTAPEPSAPVPLSAVFLVVVLMGIPITYYLIKHTFKIVDRFQFALLVMKVFMWLTTVVIHPNI